MKFSRRALLAATTAQLGWISAGTLQAAHFGRGIRSIFVGDVGDPEGSYLYRTIITRLGARGFQVSYDVDTADAVLTIFIGEKCAFRLTSREGATIWASEYNAGDRLAGSASAYLGNLVVEEVTKAVRGYNGKK